MIATSIVLGSLSTHGFPVNFSAVSYFAAAMAVILGFLASLAFFINYYSGENLRECSPIIRHLASMSKKSASAESLDALDKIANPEGIHQLWKEQVVSKGEGFHILLTGATGYVGRAFLYQLLREMDNVWSDDTEKKVSHKVYVMARAKERKNLSAAQRLEVIRDEPLFAPYKHIWNQVVFAAESGDLQDANCGMSDGVLDMLANAGITHVVHCAADVNFNRPLADSAEINISPALQLTSLAQKWPTCKRFIHCSTAFVNPGTGSQVDPMREKLFSLGKYDPQDLYDSMRGDQQLALTVKEELGFSNNYVFTKCVAEHLIVRSIKKMELKVVRPAIVGPAWALPEPSWNGDKPSTVTALFILWGARVVRMAPLTSTGMPMVPVDVVANGIIHAMISPSTLSLKGDKVNQGDKPPVSFRNLIWSHRSAKCCISGIDMARVAILAGVAKMHFSATETAISFALTDLVYNVPQLFPVLHLIFNLGPLYMLNFICWVTKTCGISSVLEHVPVVKLLRFSDMITLYKPYMGRDYYFESSINVPEAMDMMYYTACLFKATHSFISKLFPGHVESLSETELLPKGRLDLWWALTSPSRNFKNRIMAYLSCKILRAIHGSVILDVDSMEHVFECMLDLEESIKKNQKQCVLLASTYQSFLDNVLAKFVHFSVAGLGIDVPTTIADTEFQNTCLGARLGDIQSQYDRHAALAANLCAPQASETFLRTLANSKEDSDYTVVPLCMEYSQEMGPALEQASGKELGLVDMFRLYWQICIRGQYQIRFGGSRISYGKPKTMNASSDFKAVVAHVRSEHRRLLSVSNIDLETIAVTTNVPAGILKDDVATVRAPFQNEESKMDDGQEKKKLQYVIIPDIRVNHQSLHESHPACATYLAGEKGLSQTIMAPHYNGDIQAAIKDAPSMFEAANYLAARAKVSLLQKYNLENPSAPELVKEMETLDGKVKDRTGVFIFEAAASIAVQKRIAAVEPCDSDEEKKDCPYEEAAR